MTSTIGDRVEDTAASADAMLALVTSDGFMLSWEEVFDEYAPVLTLYARSRGVREPEDLVQDVFVAALKQFPGFAGDRSGLRSLLFTIAYRRIADHHRRCYRRPETLVAEHSPQPDPGPSVEQIVGLGESAGQAMQAFSVLSERERRVIQMRIFEEDSPASVGKALGLSSGNVRVIQARALVKIRKHLRSLGDGGFALPMFTLGSIPDSFRYLRTGLPAHGPLGRWIEDVRSDTPTLEAPASVSRVPGAAGSTMITWRGADPAHSLFSAAINSGGARLGAALSVVALSTLPLLPAVFLGDGSQAGTEAPAAESADPAPTPASRAEAGTSGDLHAPPGRSPIDVAHPVTSVESETSLSPSPLPDHRAAQGAGSFTTGLPGEFAVSIPVVVDEVVEPLITGTVDALMDDVIEPLVDVAAGTVEGTVAVVDSTVGAVADTVDQVEDTVQPLVDDTTPALLDDLPGTLDDVVPGVGGLLGGG